MFTRVLFTHCSVVDTTVGVTGSHRELGCAHVHPSGPDPGAGRWTISWFCISGATPVGHSGYTILPVTVDVSMAGWGWGALPGPFLTILPGTGSPLIFLCSDKRLFSSETWGEGFDSSVQRCAATFRAEPQARPGVAPPAVPKAASFLGSAKSTPSLLKGT